MTIKCAKILYKVAKDAISESEARQILSDISERAKTRAEQRGEDLAASYNATIEEAKDAIERANQLNKRRAVINMRAFGDIKKSMDGSKDKISGLTKHLDRVDVRMHSVSKRNAQSMMNFFGQDNRFDLLKNKDYARDIARVMFNPDDSRINNPKIKEIGKFLSKESERRRKILNNLGADIGKLDGYIVPQSHDASKLMSATGELVGDMRLKTRLMREHKGDIKKVNGIIDDMAFKRWRNSILPRLDEARTFENTLPEDTDDVLSRIWRDRVSGISQGDTDIKTAEDLDESFKRTAMLANKISRSRKLHFKDSDNWLGYNKEYGTGDLYDSVIGAMDGASRHEAMLRMMGTNPEAMWDKVYEMAKDEIRDNPRSLTVRTRYNFLSSHWFQVSGAGNRVVDGLTAKTGSALRTTSNLSSLGGVVFSSFPDVVSKSIIMQSNGASFLDAAQSAFEGITLSKSEDKKNLGKALEVFGQAQVGHGAGRYFTMEKGKVANQLNNLFFHANGLAWWDRSNQLGIQSALSRLLGTQKDKSWSSLDIGLQTNLSRNGISSLEWKAIKSTADKIKGNNGHFITPNFVLNLSDEQINAYKVASKNSERIPEVRRELSSRLRDYISDESQMVTLSPTARDKALLLGKSQRGTISGEFRHFLAQFKYFSLGYVRRVMGRAMFGPAATMGTRIGMMANLLVSTTITGYAGWAAKSFIEGQGVPNIASANSDQRLNIMRESMLRGGTGGMYGGFLLNAQPTLSQAVTRALGPVFGMANDAYSILYHAAYLHKHTGKAVSNFIRNNAPLHNWFAIKYALDRSLFNAMMERTSPGALSRETMKLQQKYNQTPSF